VLTQDKHGVEEKALVGCADDTTLTRMTFCYSENRVSGTDIGVSPRLVHPTRVFSVLGVAMLDDFSRGTVGVGCAERELFSCGSTRATYR
jgi:hypothetical protein